MRADDRGEGCEAVATGSRQVMVVELAEAFFLAKAVELGGDDDGRGLVGGACELGVGLQRRRALGMAEATGHRVQVGACGQKLGSGVVPEFLQRAGDADPAGVPAVPVRHGVRVPRLAACRVGREREYLQVSVNIPGVYLRRT